MNEKLYINMINNDDKYNVIENVTVGAPISYYTLPLCILWFQDSPTGVACRDRDTVVEVLSQQHDLETFVLVAKNDIHYFSRHQNTWCTRKHRIGDLLDEIKETYDLLLKEEEDLRNRGLLEQCKCGEGLWHPLSQNLDGSTLDNDQSI